MNTENKTAAPAAPASIDTPEFRMKLPMFLPDHTDKWEDLVQFIDAWGHQQLEAGVTEGYDKATEGAASDYELRDRVRTVEAALARIVAGVEGLERLEPEAFGEGGSSMRPYSKGDYVDRDDLIALLPAKAEAPCVICGSDEPRTGTCGSTDVRALCNATPAPAMGEELPPPVAIASKGAVAFFVKWTEAGKLLQGTIKLFTEDQLRACMALRQPGAVEWQGSVAQIICDCPLPEGPEKYRSGFVAAKEAILDALRNGATAPVSQPADRAAHERDMLAKAIGDALLKARIWNGEVPLTGPHLIMMLNDLVELVSQPAGQTTVPFMFAIMGPDGKPYFEEGCVDPTPDALYSAVNALNDSPDTGYSVVALYTAPQPIPAPAGSEAQDLHILKMKAQCLDEWLEKTAWVQDKISTFPIHALGKHRADVLREEVERLRAVQPKTGE